MMQSVPATTPASPSPLPTGGTGICTVVSKNYLAYARALGQSLRRYHPDIPFFVCLVDRVDSYFEPEKEPFTVIPAEAIENIPHLPSFLFKYTILELNTAVKPFLFEQLFEQYHLDKLIYFDPDILVFSPLDDLLRLLDDHGAVLTPHITAPITDDKKPSEVELLQAGSFNLGFIGMANRPSTREFLRWWQTKLYSHCIVDHGRGYFVDQKWVDLAPGMFPDFYIQTDPRYNIGYWNFHERGTHVTLRGEDAFYDDKPVVFFHFSGFNSSKLESISKHQTRFRLSDLPNLRPLYEYYRDRVGAQGHETTRNWPYAFDTWDNGVKIWEMARGIYREMPDNATRFPNPFDASDPAGYYAHLLEPVHPGNPTRRAEGTPTNALPRLWWIINQTRPDIQRGFTKPLDRDLLPYLRWVRTDGRLFFFDIPEVFFPPAPVDDKSMPSMDTPVSINGEAPPKPRVNNALRKALGVPLKLVLRKTNKALLDRMYYWSLGPEASAALAPQARLSQIAQIVEANNARENNGTGGDKQRRPGQDLPRGVNVTGYLKGEFGIAEASRNIVHALHRAEIPTSLSNILVDNKRHEDTTFTEFSEERPYRFNLITVNADMLGQTLVEKGGEWLRNRYNIGVWYWELSEFPEMFWPAFAPLDEVWVTSAFCGEAIGRVSPLPVVKITYPVTLDVAKVKPNRPRYGMPDDAFVYAFSFDFHSFVERKNPFAVVDAFREAFGDAPNQKDALLVLKSINGKQYPEKWQAMKAHAKGLNVHFIDEYLTQGETLSLFASADCLVSLHRSEGLGLGMAESMALGKPVIATAYSGNMDFMSVNNSLPVRYDLTEITEDHGPYLKGNVWANPDTSHAAEMMRRLFDDRAFAARVGAQAASDIREFHSLDVTAAQIKARLDRIASW